MKKKEIIAIVAVAVIAIGIIGFGFVTRGSSKGLAKIGSSTTSSESSSLNFVSITPKSKYNPLKTQMAEILLKDISSNDANAVQQVQASMQGLSDSLLNMWTHNGEFTTVKKADAKTPNSVFLHVDDNNKGTFAYYTFSNKQGQVAKEAGVPVTPTTAELTSYTNKIKALAVQDLEKRYPRANKNVVVQGVNNAVAKYPQADIYLWSDNGRKANSTEPVITNASTKNKIILPVDLYGRNYNVYLGLK